MTIAAPRSVHAPSTRASARIRSRARSCRPVYLTSTYMQQGLGENKGYEYARGKNPTREALERTIAALEGAQHGFAFASGMGCLDSIMKLFQSGDHIVCGANVYGGTFRLFDKLLQQHGPDLLVRGHDGHAAHRGRVHAAGRRRYSSRRRRIRSCRSPISRRRRKSRTRTRRCSSSTTPSLRRSSSSRSRSAPTSSFTRRRNI